ncbi:MAG: type II secretion system protein GspN [Desulfamplus sp.]|nr:type II secretion system protein GspN [Desulfamplus sp.]
MKFKHLFLYAIYGFMAFIVFFIVLFPKQKAANIISDRLNSRLQGTRIDIKAVELLFPIGLKAINTSVILNGGNNKIEMESIFIYPEILSLYKDEKKLDIDAKGYGGKIDGEVKFALQKIEKSEKYNTSLNLNFSNLEIKNLKQAVQNIDILASFIMNGSINYKTDVQNSFGSGNGVVELDQCRLTSENIILKQMGIEELNFTKVDIEWSKEQNILSVANLNAQGNDIKIRLNGNINLKTTKEMSQLDLKGEFEPNSARITSLVAGLTSGGGIKSLGKLLYGSKKNGIPFKITGTMQNPKISI